MLAFIEHTLRLWGSRSLDSGHPCSDSEGPRECLHVQGWHFSHLLPLAMEAAVPPPLHRPTPVTRFRQNVAHFLRQGRLRMIDFDVLPSHRATGGLGLPYLQTPAQSILAKTSATTWPSQATRPSTSGNSPANLLPVTPTAGLTLPGQPPQYAGLLDLIREVFSLNCIITASLSKWSRQP